MRKKQILFTSIHNLKQQRFPLWGNSIHVFPIQNPPPSPYHLSGSSQCTSPKHPVSCIESGLVTRFIYNIIHISMPFSQIIPPSPSSTESKRLFYIHQCLFCCLVHRVIVTIFLNSIHMRQYTVLVFFFLAYFTLYNRFRFHPPHQN